MKITVKITIIGILCNTILFAIKLIGGILSGSLALYSDSFNSLTDIIASIAIFIAVRIGTKTADVDHPFGHHRAEPIAGLIVAIFAAILGFEVLRGSFESIFTPRELEINSFVFSVIGVSIAVKVYLTLLFRAVGKKYKSPALLASSIDHRNDILVSSSVLFGSIFIYFGYHYFDIIVAFLIGSFIVYSGFKIGVKNVDFLMGKVPPQDILEQLKGIALSVEGVIGLNDVKAHYIGNIIQVEIHIEVDKSISTEESHAIAKRVKGSLENEEIVNFAFVHVDPV
ncbi:MAG: cation transporter [Spirochaetota bacterium]|nr:MAG: cation transporter [Spirochaetota bacterium]